MKKYIFTLSLFSMFIVAMESTDDSPLIPLKLTETVEPYDSDEVVHAFYNPRTESIRVIKYSNLFPKKSNTQDLSLIETFKNSNFDNAKKLSEFRTLGLAKLPHNGLFYAALAKKAHEGEGLIIGRFDDIEPSPQDHWLSCAFYTKGKLTAFQFFVNLTAAKIICDLESEYQNKYEKKRTYIPLNFTDPISSKVLESRQIENNNKKAHLHE